MSESRKSESQKTILTSDLRPPTFDLRPSTFDFQTFDFREANIIMTAKRFEDLRIWQDARIQANAIYDSFGSDSLSARDFGFRDQIQRCGVSVMNNIAEGFERKTDLDFAKFLDYAKGSCGEVRSMLYLAEDRSYLPSETAEKMRDFSEHLSRAIESLSKHLRRV